MTYRDRGSYVRFPESIRTVPERSLQSASAQMDKLLRDDKSKHRLQDQPAVTPCQNAFEAAETEN